jgi:hypothetical protein
MSGKIYYRPNAAHNDPKRCYCVSCKGYFNPVKAPKYENHSGVPDTLECPLCGVIGEVDRDY